MTFHPREAVEQSHSLRPSEPEPEDVTRVGAAQAVATTNGSLEIAALGKEAGHHRVIVSPSRNVQRKTARVSANFWSSSSGVIQTRKVQDSGRVMKFGL